MGLHETLNGCNLAFGAAKFPGSAIAFDGNGNLYSCSETRYVYVYPPGFERVSYSINVSDAEVFGGITVTADGTLYVPSYTGLLFEVAPKATAPTNSFSVVSGACDVAVGMI
ncbi:MAG TPA: hypothetical protein VKR56_03105 [Candidatus Cybelea sp.]|nr:hypothetical protein [Candidatus Cybelea sp.]